MMIVMIITFPKTECVFNHCSISRFYHLVFWIATIINLYFPNSCCSRMPDSNYWLASTGFTAIPVAAWRSQNIHYVASMLPLPPSVDKPVECLLAERLPLSSREQRWRLSEFASTSVRGPLFATWCRWYPKWIVVLATTHRRCLLRNFRYN